MMGKITKKFTTFNGETPIKAYCTSSQNYTICVESEAKIEGIVQVHKGN